METFTLFPARGKLAFCRTFGGQESPSRRRAPVSSFLSSRHTKMLLSLKYFQTVFSSSAPMYITNCFRLETVWHTVRERVKSSFS